MTTRGGRRGGRGRFYARRKVCGFCVNKVKHIDYKNIEVLRNYVSERFKMDARRKTGTCSRCQRVPGGCHQAGARPGAAPVQSEPSRHVRHSQALGTNRKPAEDVLLSRRTEHRAGRDTD